MPHQQVIRFVQTVLSLSRRGANGLLSAISGERKARLTFARGRLVFVEHRSLGGTLGLWLVTRSVITREEYHELAEHVRQHPGPSPMASLVERAVERGMIEMADVSSILSGQVERNYLELFSWDEMELRFTEEAHLLEGLPRFPCDLEALTLAGIRERFDADALRAHFTPRLDFCPALLASPAELTSRFRLDAAELKVVRLLNGERPVRELFASRSLDPSAVGHVLLALRLAGQMDWRRGPADEERDSSPSQPVALGAIKLASREEPSVRLTLPQMIDGPASAAETAFRRAMFEWKAGRLVSAQNSIAKALSLGDAPEHALLGAWLDHEMAGYPHDEEALAKLDEVVRRAQEADPTIALAYYVAGQAHLMRGDLKSAEIAFYRAHKLDPSDVRSRSEAERLRSARHAALDEED